MQSENRILILTGLVLIALTMFFGVWYAIFDEHQTLNAMGFSLASGFAEAARGDLAGAGVLLEQYGALATEYRQEIHFHGHFGFLGLTLILLGLVAHTFAFSARVREWTALLLAGSAFLFPFGVFLQVAGLDGPGEILAGLGTIGLVLGICLMTIGMLRRGPTSG